MKKQQADKIVPIIISLISVAVLSVAIFVLMNKDTTTLPNDDEQKTDLNLNNQENMTNISDFEQLGITTIKEGAGQGAIAGNVVSVHYEGTLSDGTKFDSSYDRGTPFEFTLGQNSVIQGWEQGLLGMKVGEIRELNIPSSMGYGPSGSGPIPGSAGLIFKVELLEIK